MALSVSPEITAASYAHLPLTARRQGVLNDWDRTLGDPEKALPLLFEVVYDYVGSKVVGQMQGAYEQTSGEGGTYEPITELEAALQENGSEATVEEIGEIFVREGQKRPNALVYDDTPGYVHRLDGSSMPHAALTWGVRALWQRWKIGGGNYTGHTENTSHTDKVGYAGTMYNPETGLFEFARIEDGEPVERIGCEELVVVEDKVPAIQNPPKGVDGILVRRPGEKVRKSQAGEWPAEKTISSLGQLVVVNDRLIIARESLPIDPTLSMPQNTPVYKPIQYGVLR